MKVGAFLPHWAVGDPGERSRVITEFASEAADRGVESLWSGGDHILVPPNPLYRNMEFLDPIVTVSYAAAATELPLGFVYAGWRRHPILSAKEIASLLFVAGGREIRLAPVIGWYEREHEVLELPHRERGARTDEWLQAVQLLLSGEEVDFSGRFWSFEHVAISPRVDPRLVIWATGGGGHVGVETGESSLGRRVAERIERFGRWLIGGTASIDSIRADLQFLEDSLETSGKGLNDLEIGQSNLVHLVENSNREKTLEEQARFFNPGRGLDASFRAAAGTVFLAGTIDEVLEGLAERAALGLTHLFAVPFPGQERSQLRLWEKHLIPAVEQM